MMENNPNVVMWSIVKALAWKDGSTKEYNKIHLDEL